LFGRLQNACAASGKRGREFPRGHQQRIVPRNNLSGDADRLAKREAERVGRHRIHASEDFVGQAAVVFKTGGDIRDIVLRFDDRLAGVATFDFCKQCGVLADFFGQLEKDAAAVLRRSRGPWPAVKGRARSFYSAIDVGGASGSDLGDDFLGGGVINRKCFSRGAGKPFAIDIIFVRSNSRRHTAGHDHLQKTPTPSRLPRRAAAKLK
jgi:hypothetical protein